MSIFSENRSTLKEIWSTSFHLYQKSLFRVWPIVAISCIVLMTSLLINKTYETTGVDFKFTTSLMSASLFLANIYLTSLLLLKIHDIGTDKEKSWKDLSIIINKRLLKLVSTTIIVLISYFIGIIAFVLPGIFLFILFAMVQPLILFDDHGIIDSIKGSVKLVWKNWWRTFVAIFPILLIGIWISFFTNYAIEHRILYIFLINSITGVLLYPFFYACMIIIFNDLKIRKKEAPIAIKTKAI